MFEILEKDLCARTAKFGKITTPNIAVVVNPNKNTIPAKELEKMGAEILITNSYIIKRTPGLGEKALKKGLKKLLGTKLFVMTDSGSYQMFSQGKTDVGNREIVEFQEKIGSDLGVFLDVFSVPQVSYQQAKKDVDETIRRGKEALSARKKMLLAATVQGSKYPVLRKKCAEKISKMGFDYHCIGGVVPLMMQYRYKELLKVTSSAAFSLPLEKPVHLFGAGHPMMFAFACALGVDMFDSAAYSLYARQKRYLTPRGTLKLQDIKYLPCECPVCSNHEPKDLNETLLAKHNLHATFAEIKTIRQAISEGTLWDFLEQKSKTHPSLVEAFKQLSKYSKRFARFTPVSKKKGFFCLSNLSKKKPEVLRHEQWLLKRYSPPKAKNLAVVNEFREASKDYHVVKKHHLFGAIPEDIRHVYPLGQNVCPEQKKPKNSAEKYLKNFRKNYEKVVVKTSGKSDKSLWELRGTANYLFGEKIGEKLFPNKTEVLKSKKTLRIRAAKLKEKLLATVRAEDGRLLLHEAARVLHKNTKPPKHRLVLEPDAVEFVEKGRSVFSKFVKKLDPQLLCGEEALIVDESDKLLGVGETLLNAEETTAFERGACARVRKSFRETKRDN